MGKGDRGAGGEPPLELLLSGRAVEARVYLLALIPEAALGPDLGRGPPEDDRAEPGDVRPLERGEEEAEGLPSAGRAAVDGDVGIGAEEVGLRPGLRADAEPVPEALPGIVRVEVAEEATCQRCDGALG